MKLSETTVEILKNFATINSNMLFEEGNEVATISNNETIMAKAVLPDEFPQEFGIYDLNRFLGFISRFNDPKYEFEDGCVQVINGHKKGRYAFAPAELLKILILRSLSQ